MKITILLMAVSLILILPSVLALNCTNYAGNKRDLCNNINPLNISESEKKSLMKDDVYGNFNPTNPSVNLNLNRINETLITPKTIYDEKIVFIARFAFLILFIYIVYAILTKSVRLRKWLIVDY